MNRTLGRLAASLALLVCVPLAARQSQPPTFGATPRTSPSTPR